MLLLNVQIDKKPIIIYFVSQNIGEAALLGVDVEKFCRFLETEHEPRSIKRAKNMEYIPYVRYRDNDSIQMRRNIRAAVERLVMTMIRVCSG